MLFVAMNVPGRFVWNELAIKNAFMTLAREHAVILPFVKAMLQNGVYHELFSWFRADCLDVVGVGHNVVKLNEGCQRFANEHKALLLSQNDILAIRALGPEFYRLTQPGS
jgi:hypothetical protein